MGVAGSRKKRKREKGKGRERKRKDKAGLHLSPPFFVRIALSRNNPSPFSPTRSFLFLFFSFPSTFHFAPHFPFPISQFLTPSPSPFPFFSINQPVNQSNPPNHDRQPNSNPQHRDAFFRRHGTRVKAIVIHRGNGMFILAMMVCTRTAILFQPAFSQSSKRECFCSLCTPFAVTSETHSALWWQMR